MQTIPMSYIVGCDLWKHSTTIARNSIISILGWKTVKVHSTIFVSYWSGKQFAPCCTVDIIYNMWWQIAAE